MCVCTRGGGGGLSSERSHVLHEKRVIHIKVFYYVMLLVCFVLFLCGILFCLGKGVVHLFPNNLQ